MSSIRTHYDNLKVARDAPIAVIRAAYRALAQQYHPDVNKSTDAARVMTLLNEAWRVLGDPTLRSKHDEWIRSEEEENRLIDEALAEATAPAPARRPPVGAHQNKWEKERAYEDSLARRSNKLTRLNDWLRTAKGKKGAALALCLVSVVAWLWVRSDSSTTALDRRGPPAAVAAARQAEPQYTPPPPEPAKQQEDNKQRSSAPAHSPGEIFGERWSPNGKPFPRRATYIEGMPRRAGGGLSQMTIDNTSGSSNVYVKLCRAKIETCQDLRHVFIPLGASFTMLGLAPGSYDIRYRDLSSGRIARSEPFDLRQQETEAGTRYSTLRLTLYTVRDGNTHFESIPEERF